MLLKTEGKKVEDEPVIDRLVEIRTVSLICLFVAQLTLWLSKMHIFSIYLP